MRIAKYIASCGIASRRKAEELVANGKVMLNEEIITDLGRKIEPGQDVISVDAKVCEPQKKVYYLLNKPAGYTTTLADPHAKKIITELVPEEPFVWPVGRLDRETSGLILMTNDGELTQKLTHPSFGKEKEYIATSDFALSEKEITEITNGITLEDGRIKPDLFESKGDNIYRIVIHEGRNRLIRRIFEHFGKNVIQLERTRIQSLRNDLEKGKWRELTKEEILELKGE